MKEPPKVISELHSKSWSAKLLECSHLWWDCLHLKNALLFTILTRQHFSYMLLVLIVNAE